jgi:hypothetical protein
MTDQHEEIRYRASLAGSGNPWPALSKKRIALLCKLQAGASSEDVAVDPDISMDREEIADALRELARFSLLADTEHGPKPSFLVVPYDETRAVVAAATATGERLASRVAKSWSCLEAGFRRLPLARAATFGDLSFFLVGGRMLDIDMLTVLARDGRLLRAAPLRPSPDVPHARYFFYVIEGTFRDMGAYGLDSRDLPWRDWQIGTFARNIVNGEENFARREFDESSWETIRGGTSPSPHALAATLNIPYFDETSMTTWESQQSGLLEELSGIYVEEEEVIRKLSGVGETRAEGALGEFACWYHHVAYAAAIESLIAAKLMASPEGECMPAIWYRANPLEGVLVGAADD